MEHIVHVIHKKYHLAKIAYISFYIICNIVLLLIIQSIHDVGSIGSVALISIAQLIISIWVLRRFAIKLISLPGLFIFFSYIFHLGQILLYAAGIMPRAGNPVLTLKTMPVMLETCFFVLATLFFVTLGIIMTSSITTKKVIRVSEIERDRTFISDQVELHRVRFIGFGLIYIGVLPKFYILVMKILLFMRGGYLETYALDASIPGLVTTIGNFFEYGFLMVLLSSKHDIRKARRLFIFLLFFEVAFMLTGNRMRSVNIIIVAAIIYFTLISPQKKRTYYKASVLAYIGLAFIDFIRKYRMLFNLGFRNIVNEFFSSLSGSWVVSLLSEFGASLYPVLFSFIYFPAYASPTYGLNYLYSIFAILPNIGGFLDKFNQLSIFVYHFPIQMSMGGSFIGELYYNFGSIGCVIAIFIGMNLGFINKNMQEASENKKWVKYALLIALLPEIFAWVRGYFYNITREFVWFYIFAGFLILYLNSKRQLDRNINQVTGAKEDG